MSLRLRQLLNQAFDRQGLEVLCADIGIELDDVAGSGDAMPATLVKLVTWCAVENKLAALLNAAADARPTFVWPSLADVEQDTFANAASLREALHVLVGRLSEAFRAIRAGAVHWHGGMSTLSTLNRAYQRVQQTELGRGMVTTQLALERARSTDASSYDWDLLSPSLQQFLDSLDEFVAELSGQHWAGDVQSELGQLHSQIGLARAACDAHDVARLGTMVTAIARKIGEVMNDLNAGIRGQRGLFGQADEIVSALNRISVQISFPNLPPALQTEIGGLTQTAGSLSTARARLSGWVDQSDLGHTLDKSMRVVETNLADADFVRVHWQTDLEPLLSAALSTLAADDPLRKPLDDVIRNTSGLLSKPAAELHLSAPIFVREFGKVRKHFREVSRLLDKDCSPLLPPQDPLTRVLTSLP